MNGYGYSYDPKNPPFNNQLMGGMPMPSPALSTPYPNQPVVYPHVQGQCHGQPAPYPNNSAPLPTPPMQYPHQPGSYPPTYPPAHPPPYSTPLGVYPPQPTAYPSSEISQTPQHSYPSQKSHQEQYGGVPSPFTQARNPCYSVQPTAPTAYPQSIGASTANQQMIVGPTPTVVHNPNFNANNDAQVLRKAMKGFGTDEKSIINVLCNRNNEHRQQIAKSFKTLYGKDLIKDLKSELSGKFEDLIVAMMKPIVDYYVKMLHDSISGIGTDEDLIIQVLCTLKNQDIHKICASYRIKYGKSLDSDIRADTSGCFERLMVSLCTGYRDESTYTDINAAKSDAMKLYNAGVGRLGTDESQFNAILAQRNVYQLKLIFEEYKKISGHDISDAIEREFSGYIKKALLTIVKCVKNSALYFAEQLDKCMAGAGTDDRKLIFICVTRSEVDMGEIKKAFHQKYGKTLEKRISEDASGDYQKCLIELIR